MKGFVKSTVTENVLFNKKVNFAENLNICENQVIMCDIQVKNST